MTTKTISFDSSDYIEYKARRRARLEVARAIAKGELKRGSSCALCNKTVPTEAHHVDYGRPLKIVWLCSCCHGIAHKKEHFLNPNNNPQTPNPLVWKGNDKIAVSFSLPAYHFMALKEESKATGKSFSEIIRSSLLKTHPAHTNQLEFNFEEENDDTQYEPRARIQSLEQDEVEMPESQQSVVSNLRRQRHTRMQRVAG